MEPTNPNAHTLSRLYMQIVYSWFFMNNLWWRGGYLRRENKSHLRHVKNNAKKNITCDTWGGVGWGGVGIITNLTPYTGRISLATICYNDLLMGELGWGGVGWGGDNNKPDALHWPGLYCESSTKPSLWIIYKIQVSELSTRSMFHVTSDAKISVTSDAKISVTSEDLTLVGANRMKMTLIDDTAGLRPWLTIQHFFVAGATSNHVIALLEVQHSAAAARSPRFPECIGRGTCHEKPKTNNQVDAPNKPNKKRTEKSHIALSSTSLR